MPKQPDETGREAEAWVKTILEKLEGLEIDPAAELLLPDSAPAWVVNIYVELCKLSYPRNVLSKAKGKWTSADLGALLGRHYALGKLVKGEVPLGPKTEAELTSAPVPLQVQAKVDVAVAGMFEQALDSQIPASQKLLLEAVALAAEQPYPEALAFFKGLARGAEIKPDEFASAYTLTRTHRIYAGLLVLWPAMGAYPDKFPSIAAVYRLFLQRIPEKDLGDFKSFEQACRKIGLKLRGRGRPKSKP
jgi:hypothetical protein